MKKLMFLLVFCTLSISGAWAQKTFKGKVIGPDGLGLPGVNVVEKANPVNGAATDIDGNWTLTVPNENTILEFTAIGMKPIEITAKDALNLKMESDAQLIEEVIVTGYSSKEKDEISSAVSMVTAEQLEALTPSTSVDNMLQGKAAGVESTSLNGKPGSTATVKVRGAVSLNTKGGDKSQPLYVVDGIFIDDKDLAAINPSDISTMAILKDAAGAAIYGSRAANGVVVITTKKGRLNQAPSITFSAKIGYGKKTEDPFDIMNTEEKIRYEKEVLNGANWTKDDIDKAMKLNHNWQDDILKTAKIQSYSLSARGGSEKSTYYLSLGFDQNTGIINGLDDGYRRISGRTNYSNQMTKRLKASTAIAMSYSTSDEPRDRNNVQNPFRAMYDYNPYTPVYERDSSGKIKLDNDGNPIYDLTKLGFSILEANVTNPEETRNFRILGSTDIDYEIAKWLSFKTRFSATYNRKQREIYIQPNSVLDSYIGDPSARGMKTDIGRDTFEYTWLNQINFNKSFGNHKIDGSIFTEFYKGNYYKYYLRSQGYASSELTTQDNSSKAKETSTTREKWAMFSIAAAANYSYLGKYMASASVRRDGASRFGQDKKYGIFWSGSIAWNISKEKFFSPVSFVDDLKARLSFGTLGSWDIPNYASQGYYKFSSYNDQPAAIPNTNIGNKELTWEEQQSLNFGLEYSMFNYRLRGALDYFVNTRSEFLFENPLPYEGGAYTQYTNAGKMQTNGFEFEISGDVVRGDFTWNLGLNMTFLKYKIKELNGQSQIIIDTNILKEGETPFTFYLPRYAGVDKNNGDALYYDKNNKITNTFSSGDAVVLEGKSPLPKMYGGLNSTFKFKGIDLSADFSFKQGNYIYNYLAYNLLSDGDNAKYNQRTDAFNYWKKTGDTGVLPRPNSNSNQVSDRFLQDGSYIRFRSLTLGYSLPHELVKKISLSNVRFYVQAQNIYTWTNFEGDPEISVGSGESQLGERQHFIPGAFSLYSYPATKSIMFGVDIKF